MVFDKSVPPGGYKIVREGTDNVMYINYDGIPYVPSVEDNSFCMMDTIEKLSENPDTSRVSFFQRRYYNYNYNQTQQLGEIAKIYSFLVKRKKAISLQSMGSGTEPEAVLYQRHAAVRDIVYNLLKADPLGAYMELKRLIRMEKAKLRTSKLPKEKKSIEAFLSLLSDIYSLLDKTRLVKLAQPYLAGYQIGDRSVYKLIFHPSITPDFMFTRLMARMPLDSEQLEVYTVGNAEVTILEIPQDIKYLYHMIPPEFKLSEDKYALVDLARGVLAEHQPKQEEFLDPPKLRRTFLNIGGDLLRELAESQGIDLSVREIDELARILVRHTIGFGIIELMLRDQRVQDVTINAPMGQNPVFLLHQDYSECVTNIIPSTSDYKGWASKFRLLSGRPLDEANPVLDTELIIPGARARVGIIGKPLNPFGFGFAFRRHRDKPWTLPLFLNNKMISKLAAGLISFLVDGARTMLIAGTRSSGKTSLLGSCLVELMRKYRVITIEDTLELPTDALRRLGYNIQPMKVRSALTSGGTEVSASEGIRTTLRLGDSALIVGEVRSEEAVALYEAMRIGALANLVAGTIHGDSPYGVFDRVVNDLKVPRTSFKATDIVIVANPLKSPDGLHKWRRVTQITEVRKTWEQDPLAENGFVDLMKYNSKTDQLEPTDDLINGESEILKSVGANVKEWAGNWDAIWENVVLRGELKQKLVDYANKIKDLDIMEAPFVVKANDEFHRIANSVKEEVGELDSKRISYEWEEWLKKELRKRKIK